MIGGAGALGEDGSGGTTIRRVRSRSVQWAPPESLSQTREAPVWSGHGLGLRPGRDDWRDAAESTAGAESGPRGKTGVEAAASGIVTGSGAGPGAGDREKDNRGGQGLCGQGLLQNRGPWNSAPAGHAKAGAAPLVVFWLLVLTAASLLSWQMLSWNLRLQLGQGQGPGPILGSPQQQKRTQAKQLMLLLLGVNAGVQPGAHLGMPRVQTQQENLATGPLEGSVQDALGTTGSSSTRPTHVDPGQLGLGAVPAKHLGVGAVDSRDLGIEGVNSQQLAVQPVDYQQLGKGPLHSPESASGADAAPADGASGATQACDYTQGQWVRDMRYPLYDGQRCAWLARRWACQLAPNRPSFDYENYRWQPVGCDLPPFNATDFLERCGDWDL